MADDRNLDDYDADDVRAADVRDTDDRNTDDREVPQVAALGDLHDYEVAEGYPDVRGWRVSTADGRNVGEVHELIVDTGTMRTRYLDVRLAKDILGDNDERGVLVPIGAAQIQEQGDAVVVPGMTVDRILALPPYEHGELTRSGEDVVRSHFSGTEAAADAAAVGATGAALADRPAGSDYYDHEHYDDRRFFGARPTTADAADAAAAADAADAAGAADAVEVRDAQVADGAIRVPVTRDDAVSGSRIESADDAVIRRRAAQDAQTVDTDRTVDQGVERAADRTVDTGRGVGGTIADAARRGAADVRDAADEARDRLR